MYQAQSAHDKAEIFQDLLTKKLDEIFPEKIRKLQSDDQPWISHKLKKMDRHRKRIYRKERGSEKWVKLNKAFKKEVNTAKANFYKNSVEDLKKKKPSQWYSSLKKMSSFDQLKNDEPVVDDISHMSDQDQAYFPVSDIPQFQPAQVWFALSRMDVNKATVPGDFPARLIKHFAAYLAEPLTEVYNTSLRRGGVSTHIQI